MDDDAWLTARFEEHRPRLTALASRMLGSTADADDAVQDAWIRMSRSDTSEVENLGGWLTTVVSRVCLNVLQSRRTRATVPLDATLTDAHPADGRSDPEGEALLGDAVSLALLIVLDRLSPDERVAFVLHDMFAVPFEDIAPIVGRNTSSTRQLASRARQRVQHSEVERGPDRLEHARLVEAFLAAARQGDFAALVALLDPEAALRLDDAAVAMGGPGTANGAEAVAAFSMRAREARPVLVNGQPAAAWMPGGKVRVVLLFTFSADKIAAIEAVAAPDRLSTLDLVLAGNART
jgi:RNA polymerase sigma-70 factor, ECF subfamily